jgi:hypothetical protein
LIHNAHVIGNRSHVSLNRAEPHRDRGYGVVLVIGSDGLVCSELIGVNQQP